MYFVVVVMLLISQHRRMVYCKGGAGGHERHVAENVPQLSSLLTKTALLLPCAPIFLQRVRRACVDSLFMLRDR